MGFQKPLSLPTKPNELRPNFLNSFGKLGEVKVRAGWHAREDQLGEEHVDIFGRFEGFKLRDFVIYLTHFLHQKFFLAAHVDTMRLERGGGEKLTRN